jgi:hypothetical protein
MVKAPRARHSKGEKQPVTIELGADDVTRIEEKADKPEFVSPATEAKPEASGTPNPDEKPESPADEPAETTAESPEPNDDESGGTASGEPSIVPPTGAPPPPRRGGMGSALVAGVAGGVIALLIAGGLQWAGIIPGIARNNDADIRKTAGLESDIAVLKQDVATIRNAPPDSGIASLKQALDQANRKISQQAAALGQFRDALAKSDTGESQAAASQIKGIEARLSQVEKAAKANASGAAGLTALNEKLSGQAKAVEANGQTLAGQTERIGKIEQALGALSQKVASEAQQPKVALAIAASALKAAVDRGTPFVSEFDTYASLAPKSPEIEALRKLAPTGVPTREEIVAGVGKAADAMVEAARPPEKPGGGILSDLVESARSLVKVRPVGEVAGSGTGATVARIEADIKAGDFAKAMQQYQTLPQNVQAAGSAFFARVQSRLQAEDLVRKALASALKTG